MATAKLGMDAKPHILYDIKIVRSRRDIFVSRRKSAFSPLSVD